jgi:hypothetical protein
VITLSTRVGSAEGKAALSRQGRYTDIADSMRVKEVRVSDTERFVIALSSGYAYRSVAEPAPEAGPPGPEKLAGRAAETGEQHAIKLTEAALRQHAVTGDPVFRKAAARAIELLG